MTIKNIAKKKVAALIMAVVMAVVMLFPTSVFAVARPTANDVPVGTMIIGTHLIALRSMTPQIYEIAKKSAINENQHSIYYRSEFANGKWYDITKAENIFSLTEASGKPVGNEVIDALVLTHYTMGNGKTYDLSTEVAVNVSDINSPYDAAANQSLRPLKIFADSLNAEGVGKKDTEKKDLANKVIKADYRTKQTDVYDKQIADIGNYVDHLRDTKANENVIKKAMELQEKIDNTRRTAVYSAMVQKIEEVINEAGKSTDDRGALGDLVSLLSSSQKKLNEDIQALNGKTMNDGKAVGDTGADERTAAEKQAYENEMKILDAVATKDYVAASNVVNSLSNLDNINKNNVVDREKELKTALEMATKLESEYKDELAKGSSTALTKAADSKNATEVKIEEDKLSAILDAKRISLQDMISAVELRKQKAEKDAYVKEALARTTAMNLSIPNDYATSVARENLDKYSGFLLELDKSVKAQTGVKSEVDKLSDELLAIKEKTKSALDKNDIVQADLLQKSAAEVQKKIDNLNNEIKSEIDALQKQKEEVDKKIDKATASKDNAALKRLSAEKMNIELEMNKKKAELSEGSQSLSNKTLKDSIIDAITASGSTNEDIAQLNTQIEQLVASSQTTQSVELPLYNEKAVFDEISENNIDYVPLSVIPYAVNLRLVIESENTQILGNGGKYYKFSTGSETVKSAKGDIDGAGKIIRRSDKLFVTRKFVEEQLSLVYIKLPTAGKAAVVSKTANMGVN